MTERESGDLNEDLNELEEASYSFPERILLNLCQFTYILYIAFVLEMMLLVLAVLSLLFGAHNRASQTILLLDFVLLGLATVPTVLLIVACNRR